MRVGLNLLGFRAGGIGGGSIYAEEMVRRLVADDQHEVTLFFASDPPSELQELSRDAKVVQIGEGDYSERQRILLEFSALDEKLEGKTWIYSTPLGDTASQSKVIELNKLSLLMISKIDTSPNISRAPAN